MNLPYNLTWGFRVVCSSHAVVNWRQCVALIGRSLSLIAVYLVPNTTKEYSSRCQNINNPRVLIWTMHHAVERTWFTISSLPVNLESHGITITQGRITGVRATNTLHTLILKYTWQSSRSCTAELSKGSDLPVLADGDLITRSEIAETDWPSISATLSLLSLCIV
jgi:hypothetical protein